MFHVIQRFIFAKTELRKYARQSESKGMGVPDEDMVVIC